MRLRSLFRIAGLAAVAAAAVGAPGDARACSVVLSPETFPALAPAPLNAHVWIRHPPWRRSGNRSSKRGAETFDADFVLRAVTPATAEIPVAVREWSEQLIELAPARPLPASHRFEVWAVPRPAVEPARLVASFQTGTAAVATPPTKPSFTSATRTRPTAPLAGECGPYEEIVFAGTGAKEAGELLYAVWPATNGRIAWDAPPIAIARQAAPGQQVRIDVYDALRPPTEFVAWARSSPHVGVRAMDVAGDLGEPVELDVR